MNPETKQAIRKLRRFVTKWKGMEKAYEKAALRERKIGGDRYEANRYKGLRIWNAP